MNQDEVLTVLADNWQPIDTSTMLFPGVMLVDYVRVYQRSDQTNVGCSPEDYPTADYINNHHDAYTSMSLQIGSHLRRLMRLLQTPISHTGRGPDLMGPGILGLKTHWWVCLQSTLHA